MSAAPRRFLSVGFSPRSKALEAGKTPCTRCRCLASRRPSLSPSAPATTAEEPRPRPLVTLTLATALRASNKPRQRPLPPLGGVANCAPPRQPSPSSRDSRGRSSRRAAGGQRPEPRRQDRGLPRQPSPPAHRRRSSERWMGR